MSRIPILAIIEAMLRIFAAFLAGAGRASPRLVARQCHCPAQADAFGLICAGCDQPRPLRLRRIKSPGHPIMKVGWPGCGGKSRICA